MVNLLPKKQQTELRMRYRARLATLFMLILSFVFLSGTALLMPSYFLAGSEAERAENILKSTESDIALSKFSAVGVELSRTEEGVSIMKEYQREAVAERVLSHLLANLREDVVLTGIEITPTENGLGSLRIRGIAKTRTALVDLGARLKGEPLFKGVDVPLADLVGDANLPFSLSFTFSTK